MIEIKILKYALDNINNNFIDVHVSVCLRVCVCVCLFACLTDVILMYEKFQVFIHPFSHS